MAGALHSVLDSDRADPDAAWSRIKDTQMFMDPPSIAAPVRRAADITRLVLVSDTHGNHRDMVLPNGDVLIHGGDFTKKGELSTVEDLTAWFGCVAPQFSKIVCIAGNHDLPFHPPHYDKHWQNFQATKLDPEIVRSSLQNCTYLEDTLCSVAGDLKVFGSPWTPYYFNGAFNLQRGDEILEKWKHIPEDTDILVTHGPPLGRGDLTRKSVRAGCYDLLQQVQTRVQPRVHVFGHIHVCVLLINCGSTVQFNSSHQTNFKILLFCSKEGYGATFDGHTIFVNACNVNLKYDVTHPSIVIDIPHDPSRGAVVVQPECRVRSNELHDWFLKHSFSGLASCIENVEPTQGLPSGNDLLKEDAFIQLCDAMCLHRDQVAQNELRKALALMYAESFGQ